MHYDFDYMPDRHNTNCDKWDTYPADVLPLWVADADFTVCPKIIDAMKKRLEHPFLGYSFDSQILREVIKERMFQRYNWQISTDDLILVPGIVSGFNYGLRAYGKSGDSVIYQTPAYPPFLRCQDNFGMQGIQNDLIFDKSSRKYIIDFDKFEAQLQPNTRLFILCNPHNPVGRVFTREELIKLGEICERHDVLICSDEIHNEIIYKDYQHTPIASISKELAKRTITFIAPSKTFNIPGLSCSIAIVEDADMRAKFKGALRDLCSGVLNISQEAAIAAYRDCGDWYQELLEYLESNRDFVMKYIADNMPQIGTNQIEATYLAWLDCSQCNIPGSPSAFFEKEAKVALNNGAAFGSKYDKFVRLNFATNRAILTDALDRMNVALKKV